MCVHACASFYLCVCVRVCVCVLFQGGNEPDTGATWRNIKVDSWTLCESVHMYTPCVCAVNSEVCVCLRVRRGRPDCSFS